MPAEASVSENPHGSETVKTHRIAVVGCGAFARMVHLPNIQANPRAELVMTCDQDQGLAEESRATFGARRASGDWREVVAADDVDVIVLATHTNLRRDLIVPALAAGKPVLVEKPLANSQEEMIEIVREVRRTGVPVCVGHNRRSSPGVLDLKRLLDKAIQEGGALVPAVDRSAGGTRAELPEERQIQLLIRVNDDCRSWVDWIYWDREGILFAEMVHFIDVALWLNPSPPVRVFAEGSARGNFTLLIRFQDGSLTTIQQGLAGHFDYPKELFEVTTRHVTLALDHHVELRQRGLADEPFRRVYPFGPIPDGQSGEGIEGFHQAVTRAREATARRGGPPAYISPDKGHAAHLDRFLDCVEGRGPNPCDVADAVVVTRIALKLLDAIRLGMPLTVGPEDWHIPAG